MPPKTVQLVRELSARFPALEALLNEHTESFGEILPHLYMSELLERLVGTEPLAVAERDRADILAHLDSSFTAGDDAVQNLIAVSFVENLLDPSDRYDLLRRSLPPALAEELRRMAAWRP